MTRCKVLAFLLCDRASKGPDGKVDLHGIFDRIVVPAPAQPRLFHVFYKVAIDRPCTISLKVVDPPSGEIPGNWRDPIERSGLIQSVWALTTTLFKHPGSYGFELSYESDDTEPRLLVTTLLVVDQEQQE